MAQPERWSSNKLSGQDCTGQSPQCVLTCCRRVSHLMVQLKKVVQTFPKNITLEASLILSFGHFGGLTSVSPIGL